MDPKQARNALIQFALWGIALAVIGGSIAVSTRPHTDELGFYSGDETGFWFGVVIAWLGTLVLLVPFVAWGPSSAARPGLRGRRSPGIRWPGRLLRPHHEQHVRVLSLSRRRAAELVI